MQLKIAVPFRTASKVGPYLDAICLTGLEAVPVTPDQNLRASDFGGLLLTGGTDVDPALYGQQRHSETQEPDRERDEFELDVLRQALRNDQPVLAICRGMQLLNVGSGGTLIQHLPDSGVVHRSSPDAEPGRHPAVHSVDLSGSGLLTSIYGSDEDLPVNSRHHQAVDRSGRGVVVVGRAADGVIEACEMPAHKFVVGVQWHPEDRVLCSAGDLALFKAFARAVIAG